MKQVVLQSGARVGLCLEKPEDLTINILTSGTMSEKSKVTEKFLTVRVSNYQEKPRNAKKTHLYVFKLFFIPFTFTVCSR